MIKRIKAPEFMIKGVALNEYELRQLQLDIALGNNMEYMAEPITDDNGGTAVINSDGRLSGPLHGYDLSSRLMANLMDAMIGYED